MATGPRGPETRGGAGSAPPVLRSAPWYDGLVARFLARLGELRYRGVPVGSLLGSVLVEAVTQGVPPSLDLRRRLLASLPGRGFLALRSRGARRVLRSWRDQAVLLDREDGRGVLDRVLPLAHTPFRSLSSWRAGEGVVALSHLVPGRVHSPLILRRAASVYRAVRAEQPEIAARLPEDPGWFQRNVASALDILDAAEVFWAESGCSGGVCMTGSRLGDVALGSVGAAAGRPVVVVQHGYFYYYDLPYPPVFARVYAWDAWSARRIRLASGGSQAVEVVGPFGLAGPWSEGGRRARAGRAPPTVLFATSRVPAREVPYYQALCRDLSAADCPWEVVWKPHPSESTEGYTWGPRCREVASGPLLPYLLAADLTLATISGVTAQARLLGRRVLCLAHPGEEEIRSWCRSFGVPCLSPGDDVRGVVEQVLAQPAPEPVWGAGSGQKAAARLAASLDAVLSGRDPGPRQP